MIWPILAALTVGLFLLLWGKTARQANGLADAQTLDLDGLTLYSARLGIAGRPDRIIDEGGMPIPEEWKSAGHVHDSHRAQIRAYFLLIEEETGVRPTHGYISLKNDTRERVENTPELREWVLDVADQIRAARREQGRGIAVRQPPAKCRAAVCGTDAAKDPIFRNPRAIT